MAWCLLTRWHAIFTQLRCQVSQMFFSSAGKLSIAGVEGIFQMSALRGGSGTSKGKVMPGNGVSPKEFPVPGTCLYWLWHTPGWDGLPQGGSTQVSVPARACPHPPAGGLSSTAELAAWTIPALAGCPENWLGWAEYRQS